VRDVRLSTPARSTIAASAVSSKAVMMQLPITVRCSGSPPTLCA
jgi:hypothetical protein